VRYFCRRTLIFPTGKDWQKSALFNHHRIEKLKSFPLGKIGKKAPYLTTIASKNLKVSHWERLADKRPV
jgi:hypothetical protein